MFNVQLTEFLWQSVPKPLTGDNEAPVAGPGHCQWQISSFVYIII